MIDRLRRHKIPVRLQEQTWDCGPACLSMTLAYHGIEVGVHRIREELDLGGAGLPARALLEAGREFGLHGSGIRVSVDGLGHLPPGSILFWNPGHFVVLEGVRGRKVLIVDPASGRRRLKADDVASAFGGIALKFHR
ncbi:cysteine peptidase family C39 domain-containing protein [Streptomyces sp. NPDC087228]|uniref:cysteine peptidase family C39 domain-containing protein n=1 Tax=unclassified Streptomyces TaxID=2593676 RepID=UPI003816017C